MSIHQKVYETLDIPAEEALAIVGGGAIEPRRERLNAFLADNEWDEEAFVAWIPTWNRGQAPVCKPKRENPPLPGKLEMAKNVAVATAQAAASGFKVVSEEEQEARKEICREPCEFFITDDDPDKERCSKCGCFTSYKSKLEAWHCPVDKW